MTFPLSFRLGYILLSVVVVLSTILLATIEEVSAGAGDGAIRKKPGPAGYDQPCYVFATRYLWNDRRCNEDLGLTCTSHKGARKCKCETQHQEFLPFCLRLEKGRTKAVCETRCVGGADYPCVETRTYYGTVMACVPNANCNKAQFCKCNPGFQAMNKLCHRIRTRTEDADLPSGYFPGSVHESLTSAGSGTGSGSGAGQSSRPLNVMFFSISACFPVALFLLLN